MSEFDVHESACADDMIVHMGEIEGVELVTVAGEVKRDAVVGSLRTEAIETIVGGSEQTLHRDICQVQVRCQPGEIGTRQRIYIHKYFDGDDSQRDRQSFHVLRLIGVTDSWTTFEAARDSLAKWQRRGVERK